MTVRRRASGPIPPRSKSLSGWHSRWAPRWTLTNAHPTESDREFVHLKRQVEPAVAEQIAALEVRASTPIRSRLHLPGCRRLPCHRFVDIDGQWCKKVRVHVRRGASRYPAGGVRAGPRGRIIPQGISDIVAAVPGTDLNTTIDLPLQYQAQQGPSAVDRTDAESCLVVVLDVESGESWLWPAPPCSIRRRRDKMRPVIPPRPDLSCFRNFIVRGSTSRDRPRS